jgi:hypothetical protein
MASASLSSLPPELYINILSILSNNIQTLSRLSVVSKDLNYLTTPYLYNTYTSPVPNTDSSNYLFLRTIIRRPDLARYTMRVNLRPFESSKCPHPITGQHKLSDEDTELFKIVVRYFCDSRNDLKLNETWLRELETDREDARVALLLVLLPNLEFLFFEECYEPVMVMTILSLAGVMPREVSMPDSVQPRSLRSRKEIQLPSPEMIENLRMSFSSLHSVQTISLESKYGYLGFRDLLSLFNLPALTTLEIGLANADWSEHNDLDENTPSSSSSSSSSIQRLSLMYSAMDSKAINITIGKCKNLKEFYYIYGRIHMYGPHFTPRDLIKALTQHKHTLEVLEVDFDDDWQKGAWEKLPYENLYFDLSFKEFGKLKRLKCSQQALVGLLHQIPKQIFTERSGGELLAPPDGGLRLADILPSSLEQLTVQSGDWRLFDHLRELGNSTLYGRKAFPKLRNIVLELVDHIGEDDFHLDLDGIMVEIVVVTLEEREKRLDQCCMCERLIFGK